MKINRELIKPKILYFLFLSIVSSLFIYVNIFLNQKGIREFEIGLIDTVCYIVGFLMRPLCGAIADRYRAYRSVMLVSMVLTVIGFNGLLLLPQNLQQPTWHLSITDQYNQNKTVSKSNSLVCLVIESINKNNSMMQPSALCNCNSKSGNYSMSDTVRLNYVEPETNGLCSFYSVIENGTTANANAWLDGLDSYSLTCQTCSEGTNRSSWNAVFFLALILKTIGLAGYSPLLCLLDSVTFSLLGSKHNQYGWTRMYGSFGFFFTALITGFALYGYSMAWHLDTNYTASFIIATALLAVAGAVTVTLKVPTSTRMQNPLKALPLMCLSWRVGIFFVLVLLAGACFGVFESFLAVMLNQMFRPPSYFFGIMFAVQVLVEAPLFALSGLTVSLIGEPACFVIGFAAFALRFLLTSLVPNCWLLLPVNCLHGFSFGLMFPAMLVFAAKQAPEGWQGTVQGLVSGIYFGVGQALGVLASGALIHLHGNRVTLQIWSGVSLAFCAVAVCHMLAMRIWPAPLMSSMPIDLPESVQDATAADFKENAEIGDNEAELAKPLNQSA